MYAKICALLVALCLVCVSDARTAEQNGHEQALQWRRGITAAELRDAKIVRIPKGVHIADLAGLRDDQLIETPSGRRVSVKIVRRIENAFAAAKARPRATAGFPILPPSTKPCSTPKPGETYAEILARPDSDVVCLGKDRSRGVSVAQLRPMISYLERTRGLTASGATPTQPSSPSGASIRISDNKQLATLLTTKLRDAPGSTILVSPNGRRITLNSVRAAVKSKPEFLVKPLATAK